jgi:2-polyprenyl-6-methoxyphenol hydroxylase-like FAD-dependent oxidoreductase
LYDTFIATCARTPAYFNVFTEKLRQRASIELPVHSGEDISERSVSRSTLRQVLFSGMDDVIGFGKAFTRYEQAADGTVTAFFDDGTTASGDILVSAEGTRSAVRQQYLPDAPVRDTGITAIATNTPLTGQTRALLPTAAQRGISLIFGTRALMGLVHVMEFPSHAERDYLNLSIWGVHAKFPAGVHDQRGRNLIGTALDATRNWHPHLRALLEESDPAAAFPVRIVTSAPVDPWTPTTVTLLGDAIHTMTPGQGVGANTALRDAALLCRALTAAARPALPAWPRQARPVRGAKLRQPDRQDSRPPPQIPRRPVQVPR